MKIGFIGLGNMGLPMAENLQKAGYEVTGFDIKKNMNTVIKISNSFENFLIDNDVLFTSCLYEGSDKPFLSLIGPNEWDRKHLGTFKLLNNGKWERLK